MFVGFCWLTHCLYASHVLFKVCAFILVFMPFSLIFLDIPWKFLLFFVFFMFLFCFYFDFWCFLCMPYLGFYVDLFIDVGKIIFFWQFLSVFLFYCLFQKLSGLKYKIREGIWSFYIKIMPFSLDFNNFWVLFTGYFCLFL